MGAKIYMVNGERWAVTQQTTDRVAGHGPHWEAERVKPLGDYGLDRYGRQRVSTMVKQRWAMAENSRLDLLKRKNAGERLIPKLRENLAVVLEISPSAVDFLSLEESDAVRERASHAFPPRNKIEDRSGSYPFLSKRIRNADPSRPLLPETGSDVLLILPEAEMVGVLRLPLAVMNGKWSKLLNAKPDGFILVDARFANKAVLQTDKDETTGAVVLDFAAWGTAWSRAVRDFSE